MKFRAVFLDAGETILSPHPSFAEVFAQVMGKRGHKLELKMVEAGLPSGPAFAELVERHGPWSISRDISRGFWRKVYQTALDHLQIPDSDGAHFEALYERFTRYETYRMFDDVIPTLEILRERNVTLGLISNFEEWLEGMLAHWAIDNHFDVIVVSGKEGVEKPNPEIFERALARAGVHATEAVYVGDNPRDDVEGAERVGMTGVLIDRRGRYPDFEGPKITTLDELPGLVGVKP